MTSIRKNAAAICQVASPKPLPTRVAPCAVLALLLATPALHAQDMTTVPMTTTARPCASMWPSYSSSNSACYTQYVVMWSEGHYNFSMDVDRDGRPDIVTTVFPSTTSWQNYREPPFNCGGKVCIDAQQCSAAAPCTRVFHNNGNGTYTQIATNMVLPIYAYSQNGSPPKLRDVNGDGIVDVCSSSGPWSNMSWLPLSGPPRAYVSRGNGSFDPVAYAPACDR